MNDDYKCILITLIKYYLSINNFVGGAPGELAHHTMTVFDETEDTNTSYSKQNWYIAIELMWEGN